jgi:hypothetical protein
LVIRTLTRIGEKLKTISLLKSKGLIIFAGTDNNSTEILEIIEPQLDLDIFSYKCQNKFNIEPIRKYFDSYSGSIIFANGDECIIYQMENTFKKFKHINANLIKRHRKGGQSQLRFSRLAEESRQIYITHIIDYLNQLQTQNNWIFGSEEIRQMIFEAKTKINIKISNGGFLDFNSSTINDTKRWLSYLTDSGLNIAKYDVFEKMVYYLDTNPDMLDFDQSNINYIEYYTKTEPTKEDITNPKYINFDKSSKYYDRLRIFGYIGLKYYDVETINDEAI